MATVESETPVEPLVLDDRASSRDLLVPHANPPRAEFLVTNIKNDAVVGSIAVDDDDDRVHEPSIPKDTVLSKQASNPRLDTLRHLVVEPTTLPTEGESTKETESDASQTYESDTEATQQPIEQAILPTADEAEQPLEHVYQQPNETAHVHLSDADTTALVQEFLHQKMTENECESHAKEIHEYLDRHMSAMQQTSLLPAIIQSLAARYHDEGQGEVSLDVQSSLCLLEQMLLTLGRRSPLQDMYTEEEEELLNQLGHTNSGKNLLAV